MDVYKAFALEGWLIAGAKPTKKAINWNSNCEASSFRKWVQVIKDGKTPKSSSLTCD